MMKNILFAFVCIALSISFAFAQDEKLKIPSNQIETKRAEMKKLDNWIGNWKGSGWIQQGKEKENFVGSEIVQRKLDGLGLLVEGNFKNKEGVVIHETLAVLTFNPKTKNYDFDTFLANGNNGKHELKALVDGWQWGLQFPGGSMRYTTKLTADEWSEIGEISMDDGKTWRKFFEMQLQKVK